MSRPHTPEKASAATGLTANADAQSASPLFTIFPPEIRAEIFSLALSSFSDTSKPYPFESYWYRPGYTAPKQTELSLLVSCKRIYEEARELVWKEGSGNDEEAFWWGSNDRRPRDHGGLSNDDPRERHIKEFLRDSFDVILLISDSPQQSRRQIKFTSTHWSRIRSIHLFPQMYAFSSRAFVRTFIQAQGLRPRTVKVTIRYTDWWYWEDNVPLRLSSLEPERNAYYFPESVDTLIIELESAEHKKSELEDMVKGVLHDKEVWRWKRLDDEYLELDEGMGVKEWEWMGTTRFKDQPVRLPHHPEGDAMKYIVKVLTFTAKPTHVEWDGTPFDRALAIKSYEASLKPS
ncbi:hypothetical protein BKA70DRAFT_1208677 [Coprinopsis sp. MPI-PUGE-AT-0042]|nr:hypothetical protein BKA70DRAFT_1208677 [Coprinopsis sp. MPI-PUGE-AT-0042]